MTAALKSRKFGGSADVILPRDLLEGLNLGIGDELAVRVSEDGLELSPFDEDFARRVRAFERSRRKFRNAYRELARSLSILWLDRRSIVCYHGELLAEHGGLPGPPRKDALEATLARPQNLIAYKSDRTIFDLASSCGFGFARNHCFPDGNKRISLAAIDVFVMLSGQDLIADVAEAVVIIRSVAAGDVAQDELAEWLAANSSPLPEDEI